MQLKVYFFVFCSVFFWHLEATPEDPSITFEQLYKYGKNEYTAGNWPDCIAFMLRAIEDYQFYVDETLWCRQKCAQQVNEFPQSILELSDLDSLQLGLQYATTQKALCLLRCRVDKFTEQRPTMSNYDVYEDFYNRKPYHYLQYCYWKMGDLNHAVSSAFTFLVANPKNEDTLVNLRFYMEQKDFDQKLMIDLRQMKFEKTYMEGVEAYMENDWMKCVEDLTNSLKSFFSEEQKCRYLCEDYLDWGMMQGDNPEMSIVLSSIYASVLRCKFNCLEKLSKVNGHEIKHFLASYFEYLHVCQYNVQRGRDAAQSVANALLLDKENGMMRRNWLFYAGYYNDETLFEPSEEIAKFYKRRELEKRYLKFVDTKFRYVNGILTPEQADDRKLFMVDVDINDNFDYSLMKQNLLTEKECATLHVAAQLPSKINPFVPQLLVELASRIEFQYGGSVKFSSLVCHKEASHSGCKRGALIFAVDKDRCSSLLTDSYSGCALVYCTD